jgi:flagellar assembly protein FliH
MSSRLLRSPDAVPVSGITWRQAGRPSVETARTRTPEPGGRHTEPPGDPEPEWQARIESHLEAARQQGRAEGEAAGAQRAAQLLDPVLAELRAMVGELASQRKRLRAEAEEDTVKLALAIARRVLHRELATDPEAILGLVKAAFGKMNARETHRLRVSPSDAAVIEEHRARLEFPPGLEISRDASLASGSAVFETARGELDASVDTQIGEIERGLADIVRRRAR